MTPMSLSLCNAGPMTLSDEELRVTELACCLWSGPLTQPAEHPAWAAAGHCWVQCLGMAGTFLQAMGHLRQGQAWGHWEVKVCKLIVRSVSRCQGDKKQHTREKTV